MMPQHSGRDWGDCSSDLPRVLWIELTSKCPFDCVFCSRRTLRGAGQHMDMKLYRELVAQLREPEIIRLNYSGESTHHPHIIEAIELAAGTGAAVELVTALASLPIRLVEPLLSSGLDRLTVSLHALDPELYRSIYRHTEWRDMRERLDRIAELRHSLRLEKPLVDLSAVAMWRNLSELPLVADEAVRIGALVLSIHPVIRRDEIPESFAAELDEGTLRARFAAALHKTLDEIRERHPGLWIAASDPQVEAPEACVLDEVPRAWPGPLPPGALIHGCEQNPWETAHVLADGDVVVCEVQDRRPLGNLQRESLAEIWRGDAYGAFRKAYREGGVAACRSCVYKRAHRPAANVADHIDLREGDHAQLLRGWNAVEDGFVWSKREALLRLARAPAATRIRLRGFLPAAEPDNRLELECGGSPIGSIVHAGRETVEVDRSFPLPPALGSDLLIRIRVHRPRRPYAVADGGDARERGFALVHVAVEA